MSSADNPRATDLAKFLCYLFRSCRFSPNTIALHKSVVCTFANPEKSKLLASNALVQRTMKAIKLKQQPPRKSIWSVSTIIQWLVPNPPAEDSIFQVSRYVALMLLLASRFADPLENLRPSAVFGAFTLFTYSYLLPMFGAHGTKSNLIQDNSNLYLRVPSNLVAIVSRNVFWGAKRPLRAGMGPGNLRKQVKDEDTDQALGVERKGGKHGSTSRSFRILEETPPPSPALSLQHRAENLSALNRRRMRKRHGILYAKIKSLENKVRNAVKLSEKYNKRYLRLKTKNTDPNSPATKMSSLLNNIQVPDVV
ncbi:unnamed protein product [Acanthoscelides obtectus]|uniref:Uncharacterized protein n=1 Tax=Acanthoscelides obtectus TaxID=200917 RepID=A0A9P0Q4C9_ACAOB|nr:unnamed protein product [Acanthoscelides obtectus]CAK1647804.1 hypothetical protein AOBTE_LOCUS15402 [Acanthoscelides obtectus]